MNKSAILHIPMSNYAHGISETRLVIRLRVAKGDLTSCTLYYGDTACRQTPILFTAVPMQIVASDECFDYYEADFESLYHRIYYYFELSDGTETIYYYADFIRAELVDDRSEYYKLPFNRIEDIARLPEWVTDSVIYNIFPDSFATSKGYISEKPVTRTYQTLTTNSRLGGTIQGITENVDYLCELGVNCIYINPIFVAGEYHKYDTIDYFHVDPCFGTNEEFKTMVSTMHEHGIRVMIDGVFNHCGWNFFAFEDVIQHQEKSKYKDWFYRLEFPVVKPETMEEIPTYECFAYERLMPKLNTSNPEVKDYLLKVATYWLTEFDIDGWRLDVASEVDDNFWREFRKVTKAVKPDCFIIGEVWESAGHWLDGSEFDSTMNYDFRKHCNYFFAQEELDAKQFDARVTNMRIRYRKSLTYGQLNLLDSHDVSRFYSLCQGDRKRFQLAVVFQMMFPGIPSIFYGDEQGFLGIEELDYRRPMQFSTSQEYFLLYQTLIRLRKEHEAIKTGDFITLSAKSNSRFYGFARTLGNDRILVLLNPQATAVELTDVLEETVITAIKESGSVLYEDGLQEYRLSDYGFAIIALQE